MNDLFPSPYQRNIADIGLDEGIYNASMRPEINDAVIPDKNTLLQWLANYNAAVDPAIVNFQAGTQSALANTRGAFGSNIAGLRRFAGGPTARNIIRFVPGVGAAAGTVGLGNLALGSESGGNKAMDALAMLGGAAGGYRAAGKDWIGPGHGKGRGRAARALGMIAGSGGGKAASDSLQWLFGDKQSPEQREVAEALALLKAGVV